MNLQEKNDIIELLDVMKKKHFDQVLQVKLAMVKTNLNLDSGTKKKLKVWLKAWDNLIDGIAEKSL